MYPGDLVSLGNIRQDLGDLTSLCLSVEWVGIKAPLAYYPLDGQNVLWDGHRRLRCVEIINAVSARRAHIPEEEQPSPFELYNALKEAGLLDNCLISATALADIGWHNTIDDVPALEMLPPPDSNYAAEFQLLSAASGLRKPLNAMEEAKAIAALVESGRKQQEVALALGCSTAYVSRRSRLVTLHPDFQEAVADERLKPRAAEQLLALKEEPDEEGRQALISAKTVRKVARRVQAINSTGELVAGQGETAPEFDTEDPLDLVYRREAEIAVQNAANALKSLEVAYGRVNQKPDLSPVREAYAWVTW